MNGMTDMLTKFTAKDICDILSQCHLSKVRRIVVGSLIADFQVDSLEGETNPKSQPKDSEETFSQVNQPVEDSVEDLDQEGRDELRHELRMYELMTNDPLAFEQEMIDQQMNKDAETESKYAEIRHWPAE